MQNNVQEIAYYCPKCGSEVAQSIIASDFYRCPQCKCFWDISQLVDEGGKFIIGDRVN